MYVYRCIMCRCGACYMFLPKKMDDVFKNELLIDTCPQEFDYDADFCLLSLEETREALADLTRVQKDAAMDIVFDKYCINP